MPYLDDDIVVKQLGDSRWELRERIRYEGNTECFIVPAGFDTDFASVPRPVVWLLPRYGRYTKAAILHDFLWRQASLGRFNRFDADGIFRRSMRELGVPFLRRWLMWAAVRVGAWTTSWADVVRPGVRQLLLVLAVALPGLVFVVIPAVVVAVWLVLFWVLELAVFVLLKPFSRRKQVNRPTVVWELS